MAEGTPQALTPYAPQATQNTFVIPLRIVGGNKYGRYPKISIEETWNMMVSDNYLVDYAGYRFALQLSDNTASIGRGLFSSVVNNIMIAVVGNGVFVINNQLIQMHVGVLTTSVGDVYIAENNANQIALSDGENIYIYTPDDFILTTITQAELGFIPGFLSFQDNRFVVANVGTNKWQLSDFDMNGDIIFPYIPDANAAAFQGTLETKSDTVQAVVPMPGRGNMAFVFGSTVAEQWTDVGAALFPYQKTTSFNIDYGCINPSSIAYQGTFICWIGISEEAGPVVMYTTGGEIKEVSTDGLDYVLGALKNPSDCNGFLVKLDGHLFYQFTFPTDNLSFILDLESEQFFTVSDEHMNYHIARKIVYFNHAYYFVSYRDGNLYEFGTQFTTYEYPDADFQLIPRVRICPPVRMPSQRPLIFKSLGFTIEQGQTNKDNNMVVDLAISRDGGETFGNYVRNQMNPNGQRKSRFIYQRLGRANDFTPKLNFIGTNRFTVTDGEIEAYL